MNAPPNSHCSQQSAVAGLHLGPITVTPGPTLTFPFVACVPKDIGRLYTEGMTGWFQPEPKTVFFIQFGVVSIPFRVLNLWDSHPAGRVGKIIEQAVRCQRRFFC